MKYNLIFFLFVTINLSAQNNFPPLGRSGEAYSFTMKEAVEFALDSNYLAINARRDILAAIKKKWETTARGLPQIDASVDYTNMLKQPVQLIPGEFIGGAPGTFVPVKFGTEQQMSATATVNQLLFDGSYLVALQAAKTFLEYSENAAEKTALEVRKNVIEAYGNVLLAQESVEILKRNQAVLEKNVFETQKIYENGLTEQESVEQLQITLSQVENQLRNSERMVEITKQLLNLALGIPIEKTVVLEDDLESLAQENINLVLMDKDLKIEENIDFQIAKNLTQQRELELKLEKSKALPTLSTFLNYGATGNSNEFSFLQPEQEWYQSSIWGVSLNIPIFSSLQRSARTQQAKIALDQAQTQFIQAQEQIRLQTNTAKSNYQFAIENYQTAKNNLALAERIAQKNQLKFTEGLSTSFDLRQAQTQLYDSQNNFLQAMLQIITTKAELETLLNTPKITIDSKQVKQSQK
ncbi:MAG TPA: TolC family protein [Flavobacteriaceae bacterium]|nr:TolC family protein [Flavobacteriaceae bacterium]